MLRDSRARRLLGGLAVSSLGDGMSTVTIAWLALAIAPPHDAGVYVGLALAAYTLPGVVGGITLGRFFRRRSPKVLVLAHSILRTGSLAAIATLSLSGALHPPVTSFCSLGLRSSSRGGTPVSTRWRAHRCRWPRSSVRWRRASC